MPVTMTSIRLDTRLADEAARLLGGQEQDRGGACRTPRGCGTEEVQGPDGSTRRKAQVRRA